MNTDKAQFWQAHIDAWQVGHLSQAAYCQAHQLKLGTFTYWRKRVQSIAPAFVPVSAVSAGGQVSITLPVGLRIDLPAALLAQALPAILAAVREAAPC